MRIWTVVADGIVSHTIALVYLGSKHGRVLHGGEQAGHASSRHVDSINTDLEHVCVSFCPSAVV